MAVSAAGYSIWRNTSGKTMFFAYLGLNGTTLAAGADYFYFGDLFSLWQNNNQMRAALIGGMANGYITLIKTPDAINFDPVTNVVRKVMSSNNSAVSVFPDAGSYSGSAPAAPPTTLP